MPPDPLLEQLERTLADSYKREIEAEGLLATCLQHEYDHLDGILIVDAADATDGPNPAAAPDRPGR